MYIKAAVFLLVLFLIPSPSYAAGKCRGPEFHGEGFRKLTDAEVQAYRDAVGKYERDLNAFKRCIKRNHQEMDNMQNDTGPFAVTPDRRIIDRIKSLDDRNIDQYENNLETLWANLKKAERLKQRR